MPTFTPYRLTFPGGLHLGTRGISAEEAALGIPADTLFAALLDTWQQQTAGAEQFAKPFTSQPPDPPFRLTSAFPFVGEVRFFPLPVDRSHLFDADILRERGKQIKHIRYLSEGLLRKALSGEQLDRYLFPADESQEPEHGAALQGGALWFDLDELGKMGDFRREDGRRHALHGLEVWKQRRRPRVAVSRISSASNLFHSGRFYFAKGCGLWFGVDWRHPDAALNGPGSLSYQSAYKSAMSMLADQGLGGERSYGGGVFTFVEDQPFQLGDEPRAGELAYLLSRYHPQDTELPDALTGREDTAYTLSSVAGWLRSPDGAAQRRKRLWLADEGSLVVLPGAAAGDVSDVAPKYENTAGQVSYPVYRYGLACGLRWPARGTE